MTVPTGRIVAVEDHGTIVTVLLRRRRGRSMVIHFDHRPFWNWFEATGLAFPRDLIGKHLEVAEDGKRVGLPF